MFLEIFVDPFIIFSVFCIALPLIVERERLLHEDVVRYFTEPAMLFAAALLFVVVVEAKIACWRYRSKPLTSFSERMRARWYLLNGVIVHILLDGLVGVFKANTLLSKNYAKFDKRYAHQLGNFDGSAVHIISFIELCITGPVCILLYRAYQTRSSHRDALEFFTCVTQAYGTIIYLGQEIISGMRHFDVDYNFEFTLHYLLYFWFAIVFGCVLYIIIPCLWGWRAYKRLVATSSGGKSWKTASLPPVSHAGNNGVNSINTNSNNKRKKKA